MKEEGERAGGGASFPWDSSWFEFQLTPEFWRAIEDMFRVVSEAFRRLGESLSKTVAKALGWESLVVRLLKVVEREPYKPGWRDVAPQLVRKSSGYEQVHRRPHARGRW
jgi:hypothetical protein